MRIDRHLSEYLLFQTLWVLFKTRFNYQHRQPHAAFETQAILQAWQHLPPNVLRPERNKRQHLSGVLARNEVDRDYAYNRALFQRVAQGWYQFNPKLSVRRKVAGTESWVPLFQALNLPFINEFALQEVWPMVDRYLMLAGLPERTIPIAAERALDRQQTLEASRAREARERQDALALQIQKVRETQRQLAEKPAPWGSVEAKRQEIERVRREIEARKRK